MKTQTKPNTREGLKPVMVYLTPQLKRALGQMKLDTGKSHQEIIVEAIERAVRQ